MITADYAAGTTGKQASKQEMSEDWRETSDWGRRRSRSVNVSGVEALQLHGCSDHDDGRLEAQNTEHEHQ